MKDESPDQTQDKLRVAINNFLTANVDQLNLALDLKKIQSCGHILHVMESHLALLSRLEVRERGGGEGGERGEREGHCYNIIR